MENLNRNLLDSGFAFPEDLKIGTKKQLAEKVMQFGEGGFLRAFVDYMFDELNSNDLFNGSITVVQPIDKGLIDMVNAQDGLYTVLLRGLSDNKEVNEKKIVTSIRRGINPYTDFDDYFACAKNPELRVLVSNTTEAGIAYNANDKLEDKPQISFPGKMTAFLYERFKIFGGDTSKGFIIIPCELIEENGTMLKKYVMQYAQEWNLGKEFIEWLEAANYFTNTLVDRIVTGYPRDEVTEITDYLGYKDNLLDTAEIFHYWVIEAPKNGDLEKLSEELPFTKIGLNVKWTHDCTPYKARKVRILNGAHTMSVLTAYLSGKNTVGEMMADPVFNTFLKKGLFDEIIPTIVKYLPYDNLKAFSDAVFDRFANPYIKHYLLSIALNSVSKYKARVLPSILDYIDEHKALPNTLTFSLAGLIAFYEGKEIVDGALIGVRNGEEYKISDDLSALEFFKKAWDECDRSKEGLAALVKKVCANQEFWGRDLNEIEGFAEKVSEWLCEIETDGAYNAIKHCISL